MESVRVFEQLLEEVERSFPNDDPERGTGNKILNELISTLREKIRHQKYRKLVCEKLF